MPKRQFPFDGSSPLQLKTYVNAFHYEKANNMDSIYGRCWSFRSCGVLTMSAARYVRLKMIPFLAARTRELMNEGSLRLKKTQAVQKSTLQVEETFKCQSCLLSKCELRVICAFCERSACEDCSRQCVHCAGIFCSLCSIIK